MSDDQPREGESTEHIPDRSDRVFEDNGYWYFHTREGVRVGPFDSKELALKGTNDYVGFAMDADPGLLDSLSDD